ncbi:Asp/Glu/hydantoin racemase [Hypericibacter adhaerens]|uniref:Asp/Glu/hydantoin racemase n=1 Tax=Hypericibacter adhaerens TaxID=2602016 RepID=A0A5J6N3D7_9PROT|nr:flavin reductase family protein [Hypericibacter adhaerens]QEX23987.1 Asp/Glu/hydantoin racemase [Hypericibacter adhaerens]
MADDYHYYEPSQGHGLTHDPFNAIVGPRPIGWISTRDETGRRNLAPDSFFNAFCYRPPIIGFASNGWKDTVGNIAKTGEFVWNLVVDSLAEKMNATSAAVSRDTDEFDLAGLLGLPGRRVRPDRVAGSPVHFECRLCEILQLKDAAQRPVETWMTFGEVVAVHIDRSLLVEGIYQTAAARPVLRAGGRGDYALIQPEAMFFMMRPG